MENVIKEYKRISHSVTPGNPEGHVAAAILVLAAVIDSKFPKETPESTPSTV